MIKSKKTWKILGYVYLLSFTALCLIPLPPSPTPSTFPLDKIIHFLGYFFGHWINAHHSKRISFLAVFLICLGVLIELIQGLTNFRSFEVADIVANSTGVLVGACFYYFFNFQKRLH